MDLIYEYLRGRQLFSRVDFVDQFASPVVLFRRLKRLDDEDLQRSTLSGRGLMTVHQLLSDANREILSETHQYRVLRLDEGGHNKGRYRVGRSRGVELMLGHSTVSKLHALIEVDAGRVMVVDAQSKNGTRLNGVTLKPGERHVLRSGDELSFGDVTARYLEPQGLYDELTLMTRPKQVSPD